MFVGEDIDSGMESLTTSSKDLTPEKNRSDEDDETEEEDIEETLSERLWGLTEMFPDCVRNTTNSVFFKSLSCIKGFYGFTRSATWIVFSSSVILFAPIIFEVERAQMAEAQRSQQKQVLLGPSTAMSGAVSGSGLMR